MYNQLCTLCFSLHGQGWSSYGICPKGGRVKLIKNPIRLIRKTVWSDIFCFKKILLQIKKSFFVEKKCGPKKLLVHKSFWTGIIVDWKKILVGKIVGQKNCWSEKLFGHKFFGGHKNVWSKKFLGL